MNSTNKKTEAKLPAEPDRPGGPLTAGETVWAVVGELRIGVMPPIQAVRITNPQGGVRAVGGSAWYYPLSRLHRTSAEALRWIEATVGVDVTPYFEQAAAAGIDLNDRKGAEMEYLRGDTLEGEG